MSDEKDATTKPKRKPKTSDKVLMPAPKTETPAAPEPPEGFKTQRWQRKRDQYLCTRCKYDTLNRGEAEKHWRQKHVVVRPVATGVCGVSGGMIKKTVTIDKDKIKEARNGAD